MKSLKVLMVVAVMMVAGSAFAATQANNGVINATVTDACTVSGFTLNLGTYNAITGSTPTPTSFTVRCTAGTAPELTFGDGNNASATSRQMLSASTSDPLEYTLTVQGTSIPLGDASPGAVTLADDGSLQTLNVTGSIPLGQFDAAAAADYTDTVVITVTF